MVLMRLSNEEQSLKVFLESFLSSSNDLDVCVTWALRRYLLCIVDVSWLYSSCAMGDLDDLNMD